MATYESYKIKDTWPKISPRSAGEIYTEFIRYDFPANIPQGDHWYLFWLPPRTVIVGGKGEWDLINPTGGLINPISGKKLPNGDWYMMPQNYDEPAPPQIAPDGLDAAGIVRAPDTFWGGTFAGNYYGRVVDYPLAFGIYFTFTDGNNVAFSARFSIWFRTAMPWEIGQQYK